MYAFKFQRDDGDATLSKPLMNLLRVSNRPVIPPAVEIINTTELADGTVLYEHTGRYQDREITIACNFLADSKDVWIDYSQEIQKALLGTSGRLSLSEDATHYFKVRKVEITDMERAVQRGAIFNVVFTCEAYRYMTNFSVPLSFNVGTGGEEVDVYNSKLKACPRFVFFSGNSDDSNELTTDCTITINHGDKTVTINNAFENWMNTDKIVSYIELDTSEKTLKKYYTDGTFEYYDDDVNGVYQNLYLNEGSNVYTLTTDRATDIKTYFYRELREL